MLDAEFNSESNGTIFKGGSSSKMWVSVEKLVLEVFCNIDTLQTIFIVKPNFLPDDPPVKMVPFDSELNSASSTTN